MPQIAGSELRELGYYWLDGFAACVDNNNLGWSNRLSTQAFQQPSQVIRSVLGCDNQGNPVHHDVWLVA
jgi:hypothetical protein